MRRFLSRITENALWKIFSFIAAIMLWVALVDAPELTMSISVPVEFKNFPVGLDIGSEIPDRVQLQVRGPRDALTGDAFARTAVVLDLAALTKPAERTFNVPDGIVALPERVTLVQAVPFQLRIVLERHVRREVPVQLRVKEPEIAADGYRMVRSEVSPSAIVISGPESHVQGVEAALTDLFDFGTIDRSIDKQVLEGRLHTFVEDARVRIDSASTVQVKVFLERIHD